MRPKIEDTWFGSITVEGARYEYDIIIRLSGKVRRRNKQLSKAQYGTSHTISLDEIRDLYRKRARRVIIGTGQENKVVLSPEAARVSRKEGLPGRPPPNPASSRVLERSRRRRPRPVPYHLLNHQQGA